jgi:(1->4)-alpha-D-glucan 1-alpha-D-glucosylmutase
MMAKSLEDTAFYRFHRLLALNEVGGNPAADELSIGSFHERMQQRASRSPHGLTATATHDTKRGEDARTRLIALCELADEWRQGVQRWRQLNGELIASSGSSRIPSPAHEYMLYQALLGAWPLGGIDANFVERMQAFAVKAAREGKQQTSWLAPNERYERGLEDFLRRLLDRGQSAAFIDAFDAFARRAALIGALNSLAQVVLKAAMPGVPDFYQGTELWDLSLVDPDNRRPVDFAALASALTSIDAKPDWRALASTWPDGRVKFALTRRLLALRQQLPDVFTNGSYRPLAVIGTHRREIVAFARLSGRNAVIVVTGRLFGRATEKGRHWPSGAAWNASVMTEGFSAMTSIFAGGRTMTGPRLAAGDLFDVLPVAVLRAQCSPARPERLRIKETADAK